MLVLTIVTVLQFCKLRYKMLVRSINLSVWYYVKDDVVWQALCASSNCLCTKSKSMMLRPLEGEVGYELSRLKWSNSGPYCSGFLSSDWLNLLMVLFNRPFPISPWLTMLLGFDVHLLYAPIYCFHLLILKLFVHVSLGFLPERFWKSIENNNHSRIIYRNDNIARLGKT